MQKNSCIVLLLLRKMSPFYGFEIEENPAGRGIHRVWQELAKRRVWAG
jgi:hypothetical protein